MDDTRQRVAPLVGGEPLAGVTVVSLALNLPGPLAAAELRRLGAAVTKVEPPGGDPLQEWQGDWYRQLHRGIEVVRLDLKVPAGQEELHRRLADADLLITAFRPAALERLGLGWEGLAERHRRLRQVAILGEGAGDGTPAEAGEGSAKRPADGRGGRPGQGTPEPPGHDLNYQGRWGLVDPPSLPRTLVADLGAALQAMVAALALLRGGGIRYAEVALDAAAEFFAGPLRWGLTAPGGALAGGLPRYGIYRARDGWVALAALEDRFWRRLQAELGLTEPGREELEEAFRRKTARQWEEWGRQRSLPLTAVRFSPPGRRASSR